MTRQPIQIVPWDPAWTAAFEAEHARIAAALGSRALRIEHNGSTAVPGLAAKPVVDIQVSVDELEPLDNFVAMLATIGYVHLPHPDDAWCPFFYRPAEGEHTHHVHVVEAGGVEERRTLAFRDYLRDHPETALEYAALKRQLAHCDAAGELASGDEYAAAKGPFIERVIERALEAGYPAPPAMSVDPHALRTDRDRLIRTYEAFNARNVDAVLAMLHPDVDWPNGWEGGRLRGRDAVRRYWLRQWAAIAPRVEPIGFAAGDGGRTMVRVHQLVRDRVRKTLFDGVLEHVYEFENGLVKRMDIAGHPRTDAAS